MICNIHELCVPHVLVSYWWFWEHSKTYYDCQGTPNLLWSTRDIDRSLSTMVLNNSIKWKEAYSFNSTDILKRRVTWQHSLVFTLYKYLDTLKIPCERPMTKCAEGQEIPGLTTIHQLTKRPAHLPSSPVSSDVQNARHRLESAIWAWRDPGIPWYRSKDWFTMTSKLCIFDW